MKCYMCRTTETAVLAEYDEYDGPPGDDDYSAAVLCANCHEKIQNLVDPDEPEGLGPADADVVDVNRVPEPDDAPDDLSDEGRRRWHVKGCVEALQEEHDEEPGAPAEEVIDCAVENGVDEDAARETLENLRKMGEAYQPTSDYYRVI